MWCGQRTWGEMAGVRAPEVVGTEVRGGEGNGGCKSAGSGGDRDGGGNGGCKSSGYGGNRARGGNGGVRAPEVVGTEDWGNGGCKSTGSGGDRGVGGNGV